MLCENEKETPIYSLVVVEHVRRSQCYDQFKYICMCVLLLCIRRSDIEVISTIEPRNVIETLCVDNTAPI